ncbi:MAG: MerR family transcriptional regulator [Rhodothermales bacterium]
MRNEGIKKLYYSIGEVGEMMGLEPHVLRFWQAEFDQLRPRKNRAGRRIYTLDDIAVVRRIYHLLRVEKYTIEGARQVMARKDRRVDTPEGSQRELIALRGFLENLLQRL